MVGSVISHYRVLAKLGEGGMGAVYQAEDTVLQRIVAVKVIGGRALTSLHVRIRSTTRRLKSRLCRLHFAIVPSIGCKVSKFGMSQFWGPTIDGGHLEVLHLKDDRSGMRGCGVCRVAGNSVHLIRFR